MHFKQIIEKALQELVNDKHLYQTVTLDFEPCVRAEAREVFIRKRAMRTIEDGESEETITQGLLKGIDGKEWWFGINEVLQLCFSVPPVRLLCSICRDVEPFNLFVKESPGAQTISLGKPGEQVFWFPLQCQSCKNSVIVLLVRRIGRKLTLVGRSEFEEVQVPPSIPKDRKRLYSDAVIAFNSGQPLPALFLLRTLIEQHMRAVTEQSEQLRGDDLCDKYAETLDDDFKERFPSFKAIYGTLSDALHKADRNATLFESQRSQIELHFDGLAIFSRSKSLS